MIRCLLFMAIVCASACRVTPPTISAPGEDRLPVVRANDNRAAAGTLHNGVLTVRLVAMNARWFPEVDNGASADVVAFAEEGKAPQIPAPLLRVPVGTTIEATIRNAVRDSVLWVHWLDTKPSAKRDSVPILPGATRLVRFTAGSAGTYMYRGSVGYTASRAGFNEREQLAGAFVVDAPGVAAPDRVFVINIWSQDGDTTLKVPDREALAINGKSWPYTEPLTATTGDTLRWRVINGSRRTHPMHLHGFYFRVDARGSSTRDTLYPADQRRLAVTEDMIPFSTMAMAWVPDRPGNWLFHCHLTFHVSPGARLAPVEHQMHSTDPRQHMAGLVMGIAVRPAAGYREAPRVGVRQLNLFVDEGKPSRYAARALSFVQQHGTTPPAADSVEIPGTTLVLTRGEPTDIRVTNRIGEAASIHWHGIELESFSDGVAGWSGTQKHVAPAIAPGGTFTAHLTLPRAGTFMYHTHMNDIEQVTSGLYGAIVVLEPGKRFDPEVDHLYIAGWDGDGIRRKALPMVVNFDSIGPARTYNASVIHRFRFVNIGPATPLVFELKRDSVVAEWIPFAKDGADMPAQQASVGPASRFLDVGETFDAMFTPRPGDYTFVAHLPGKKGPIVFRQQLTFTVGQH